MIDLLLVVPIFRAPRREENGDEKKTKPIKEVEESTIIIVGANNRKNNKYNDIKFG